VKVRVAEPGGDGADEHFVGPDGVDLDIVDDQFARR
jgi:hypothetical protein